MSEAEGKPESTNAPETPQPPPKSFPNLRPWKPGQSGNGKGRPRIEPRVRRFARRYDRRMCLVLASIAEDVKAPPSERRKAAMDLVAIGSGRPALIQEIAGRNGEQLGPLVALNFGGGMQHGQLSPQDAYRMMCEGVLEADPKHPSFERQVIEQQPVSTVDNAERPAK